MRKYTFAALAFATVLALASEAPAPTQRLESYGDHIGNFNFKAEIEGVDAGQFTAVDGLSVEQEVIEFSQGDENLLRKRPGRVKYGDITLKKGLIPTTILSGDPSLLRAWIERSVQGQADMRNGMLTLQVLEGQTPMPSMQWMLSNCFPSRREIRTELDHKHHRILVEAIRLSCDVVEEIPRPRRSHAGRR
jgi:phage tail-like protein